DREGRRQGRPRRGGCRCCVGRVTERDAHGMSVLAGLSNIGKVPELRRRVLFTLGLLAVYRIGAFVTIPGVDRNVMKAVVNKQGGGLLGFFNMFSGGALGNLSILAIGIMPYISASIVSQLLGMVFKPLDELRQEGEQAHL